MTCILAPAINRPCHIQKRTQQGIPLEYNKITIQGSNVLLTGTSMGIGGATAEALAAKGANLILFARSEDKLQNLAEKIKKQHAIKVIYKAVDIQDYTAVEAAVKSSVQELGKIDILVNNAGLALGAPSAFHDLRVSDILIMNNTNINGLMFVAHVVLKTSMIPRAAGTILNITSVTGLEVPPSPGGAVYHSNKATQEIFTNALRNELIGTNIRVMALRPGYMATNFHSQRVGHDKEMYNSFFEGFQHLELVDIAELALYVLERPLNRSMKTRCSFCATIFDFF